MIDFHSHILPGIDDGISSYEDAILVLNEAKNAGFTKIIATSHYSTRYHVNERKRLRELEILKNKIEGIELFLGNEVYIGSQIDELIKTGEASTINRSKYILFELPLRDEEYPNLKNIILDLISKGYWLVLAHPERYTVFQKNPTKVEELLNMGVYLQANFASIDEKYGKKAKKTLELFLQHNMISFLGTDTHRVCQTYCNVKMEIEKIVSIIGKERFNEISAINPQKVIENKRLELPRFTKIHRGVLGNFK